MPQPSDWRSVRLDQNSHDRNVEIVMELESPRKRLPGMNASTAAAQFLGELAANEQSGDENLRLGFEIHGFLNDPTTSTSTASAAAGTEVWFDIDRTRLRWIRWSNCWTPTATVLARRTTFRGTRRRTARFRLAARSGLAAAP